MESFRSRFKGRGAALRLALRRASPASEVDREAIRRHWFALDEEDRFDRLRFDDPVLVQRMHSHMNSLCRNELWCRRNLLGGLTKPKGDAGLEEEPERLRGFGFECPAETDCVGRQQGPIAFAAVPTLAASPQLFEDLESALGGPLLSDRPALQRGDWAVIVEDTPSSWKELQQQAMRLVELALFASFQDARARGAINGAVADASSEAGAEAAAAAAQLEAEDAEAAAAADKAAAKRMKRKAKKAKSGGGGAGGGGGGIVAERPGADDAAEAAQGDQAVNIQEEVATHPCHVKESRRQPSGTRAWSAWLRDLAKEDTAVWRLMIFRPAEPPSDATGAGAALAVPMPAGLRAVVKNTFVDLEQDPAAWPPPALRRSCYF